LDVLNELESLKPFVQQQITELGVGATAEPQCLNGTYAASCRIDEQCSADSRCTAGIHAVELHFVSWKYILNQFDGRVLFCYIL
jgi:hypothetical protein